jgi:hypothetical protein
VPPNWQGKGNLQARRALLGEVGALKEWPHGVKSLFIGCDSIRREHTRGPPTCRRRRRRKDRRTGNTAIYAKLGGPAPHALGAECGVDTRESSAGSRLFNV